jgi:hypothetical protein
MAPAITWVAYFTGFVVGLAFLWRRADRPVFQWIGISLLMSFLFTTAQLVMALQGIPNTLLQYTWPIATTLPLLWGITRYVTDFAVAACVILAVAFLAPMGMTGPDILVRPISAMVLAYMLWRSEYHRSGLEAALWIFYMVPLPALVIVRWDASVFLPMFIFYRTCHLVGILTLAGWLVTHGSGRSLFSSFAAWRSSLDWRNKSTFSEPRRPSRHRYSGSEL